mmetsp:Transcript_23653/g.50182  ORF Transcript_23653/g.50182 Transcript_23653/m.50182 type:complete len:298 (+) Transcript_23653:594-1487(+)
MRETIPNVHISKLWRIQNHSLWSYYSFHKDRLLKNDIQANERRVWHRTRALEPSVIYQDKLDGFMMQYAAQGYWGRGIYFADKASYSKDYSYKPPTSSSVAERPDAREGESEMFLTRLLVGKEIKLDQNRSLTVPPSDPSTGLKYNTVTGETQCSQVWIVYENGRAYPEYLVRYYTGDRDKKRSPYESVEEAKKKSKVFVESAVFEIDKKSLLDDDGDCRKRVWEFCGKNGWEAYDATSQVKIEKTYQECLKNKSASSTVIVKGPEWKYEIDVNSMTQTNIEHTDRKQRKIRFRRND